MLKILLTGAAGSVGYATLKLLIKRKYDINVLELETPRTKKKLKKYKNKINVFYGSINDEKIVSKALEDVDIIIHLATVIPPLADAKPDLARTVNFYGTKNIIDNLKKMSKQPFLIYTSSVSVYGDRINNPWIKVGDELNTSEGDYYASRYKIRNCYC